MFKLQPNPTFKAAVTIPVPEEGGEGSIKITFRHKTKTALAEYMDRARGGQISDIDAMMEICEGWEGLDADFSRENMAALLDNYPSAAMAINDSYVLALTRGRAKN